MHALHSLLSLLAVLAPGRQGATCIAASSGCVAVGGHGGVDLYIDEKITPLGGARNVFALCFHEDALLEAGGRAGEGGKVQRWEWKSGRLVWSADDHDDVAYSIAVAGGKVFSGSGDRTISVRELETGKRLQYLTGHAGAVLALAASPDGKVLASAGSDRSIRLWDVEKLALLRAINNHGDSVNALAWSPDGKLLASGSSDRTVRVWQPEIGRLVRIVRGHEGAVLSLAFTAKQIVSGSSDGKVRLIDASSDAILRVLDDHHDWVCGIAVANDRLYTIDWTGKLGSAPLFES